MYRVFHVPGDAAVRRRFGVDDAMERIKGLRAIWLSHRHADHHVGMPLLLATRRQLLPGAPPIPLFGPFPMRKVLSACGKIEDLAVAWYDQYSICPQEQGKGRGLDFFWNRLKGVDVTPVVSSVCQVPPAQSPRSSCPQRSQRLPRAALDPCLAGRWGWWPTVRGGPSMLPTDAEPEVPGLGVQGGAQCVLCCKAVIGWSCCMIASCDGRRCGQCAPHLCSHVRS